MLKKSIAAATLTVGLVLGGAGVASAHECWIPDRSDRGNAGSTNSQNWATLYISELFASAHEFLGGAPLTPAQVDEAVAMAEAAGIPTSLTTFTRDTLPKGKGGPDHSSDGKGIDHFFHTYEAQLVEIFLTVQAG
ncbi:hypothetical protein [Microbacterium cremeum]|uniref:hypothetical protein n=1 Tax=Microbacterium cremeum TaxID=2782169 RepID=UPI0018899829|nr:hypothetical protein [Microbacterium cremeum]